MLRGVQELKGLAIGAKDGRIGEVDDFFFDDQSYTIRYLVVDTGKWLLGRKVLISPASIRQPDWENRVLPVSLTKEQVKNSPDVDTEKPVSRQQEIELNRHYGWPMYWGVGGLLVPEGPLAAPAVVAVAEEHRTPPGDPHLRSARELNGYHIQATDGEIGHLEDFLVDDENWVIRYLVADTRNWLPGKKVLVAPAWVRAFSWEERSVVVDLDRQRIQTSPEYHPGQPVKREYEDRLHEHYGRPKYWR